VAFTIEITYQGLARDLQQLHAAAHPRFRSELNVDSNGRTPEQGSLMVVIDNARCSNLYEALRHLAELDDLACKLRVTGAQR
jgi:hypothetical protein